MTNGRSTFSEGLLLTCSFDYLTDSMSNMSFTAFFFIGCYFLPLLFIIFFYSQIVMAVVSHERALKAQAKKMNVESLRSNEASHRWSIDKTYPHCQIKFSLG